MGAACGLHCQRLFRKKKKENIIAFSIIFRHWDGAFSLVCTVCWWRGDAKNQGITYHDGINLVLHEYSGISTRSIIHLMVDFQEYFRPASFAINSHINDTVWTLADSIHEYVDGLVQERRNSIAITHWSYVFLALAHRYTRMTEGKLEPIMKLVHDYSISAFASYNGMAIWFVKNLPNPCTLFW